MKVMKEAPRNHQEAKKEALIRDSFKCLVTGRYDHRSWADFPEKFDLDDVTKTLTFVTQCAHIIPESTYFDITKEPKKSYAASLLAVLQRFGYSVEKLNGPKIHSLFNVMTLSLDVHDAFDTLELWFEATQVQNQYLIKTTRMFGPLIHSKVTFRTSDSEHLPVPSSDLLALHAACAKVANLSGAAGYIDKLNKEMDDHSHSVLSSDGSSAHILQHAFDNCGSSMPRCISTRS